MLYYSRTDIRKRIDPTKSKNERKCIICHFWLFNHRLKFQHSVSNGCHDLAMLCLNISNIAIVTVKGADYRCFINDISKSEAIHFLENYILDGCWYI